MESKELDICPCITARYDAGICKHKAERDGVLEEQKSVSPCHKSDEILCIGTDEIFNE